MRSPCDLIFAQFGPGKTFSCPITCISCVPDLYKNPLLHQAAENPPCLSVSQIQKLSYGGGCASPLFTHIPDNDLLLLCQNRIAGSPDCRIAGFSFSSAPLSALESLPIPAGSSPFIFLYKITRNPSPNSIFFTAVLDSSQHGSPCLNIACFIRAAAGRLIPSKMLSFYTVKSSPTTLHAASTL